ncbi:hypothetical protein SAMN05519104_5348 [Rhizobiales bacterium GAS188]|nr:hypothetical protein SAMN05519104_5348 [Rhizobiales bacterium GAS188]
MHGANAYLRYSLFARHRFHKLSQRAIAGLLCYPL